MSIDLPALVAEYGSPLYVYDLDLVRQRARELRAAVPYQPLVLQYAIKANPCPAVAQVLVEEGYGVDAVSPGEVGLARRLGLPPDRILFTENNMSDAEMHAALADHVPITCGSLDRLRAVGEAGAQETWVRFNPDVGGGHNERVFTAGPLTKFGIHHSQVADVRRIEEATGVQVVGAHMHIGSGILDADLYAQAMNVIRDIAVALPHLRAIDVGGGLGIPYRPGETGIDLAAVGTAAARLMEDINAALGRTIELRLEPGRFLVGEAGSLLTTVASVKANPDGRVFVGTDTGFNHLIRPCMYGSYHRIDNLTHPDGPVITCDVVGNICESGDIFARDRQLPEPRVGDILAIRDAGAYGASMASTYNIRPLPAEITISGDQVQVARRRQTIEEILNGYQW